jgi:exosortase D (VPLPA-CTERM-specific)
MKELAQIKPGGWIKFTLYGLLLLGIYYSTFIWLVAHDWEKEGFTYCWLIPPVVVFLIWFKRDDLASLPSKPSWLGLIPICVGIIFFWMGELGGEYFTLYLSSWWVLVGICLLHLGWEKMKIILFPLFFILTMFPVPDFINTRIMLQLRFISSKLGVDIIHLFGLPAIRTGNIIDLGFARLQVVDACSGLHSLISLMVLCLLLVYFFKDHIWKRLALFMSSIPLAIVTNSFRIAVTAVLYKYFGARAAEGFFHEFSGLLIFAICIPVLLIEMKVLEKLPPVGAKTTYEPKAAHSKTLDDDPKRQEIKAPTHGWWLQPGFIVVVILLVSTLAISQTIDFREKIPTKKNLEQFPLKIGDWSADRHLRMAQYYLDVLDLSEYVIIDYKNPSGKEINFYVAYYESQRKGESIHSPATCLPGNGWSFNQSGTVKITNVPGDHRTYQVNRAVMQLGENKQITYYWFPARGRILDNAYQLKIYNFWDALTKQRTDGALVRLITRVYAGEKPADAERRLQNFVRVVAPVLDKYLPGKYVSKSAEG